MTRTLLHAAGVLVLAALLLGPSAQAPSVAAHHAQTSYSRSPHDLMMGRNCGASIPLT
jgi:hypothetical protein